MLTRLESAPPGSQLPLEAVLDGLPWTPDGLITAIAQQYDTGEVLMLAWMNRAALVETLSTGQACYWSRARRSLWRKGETSGCRQRVINVRFDCDGDAVLLQVDQLGGEHVPETEEYGITSFVYRARRPFHPERFHEWINQEWPGVVRSKGYFWLASRPTMVGSWSQAGAVVRHELAGLWWAAVPRDRWPQDEEGLAAIRARWDDAVGDAQQELVLIGIDMDEAALRARLDACLLNDTEYASSPAAWTQLPDPFPRWAFASEEQTHG